MSGEPAITPEMVASAVQHHLNGRTVTAVEDRGVWIRHNYRVELDGDSWVYLKVDQAFPASEKEAWICELLRANSLPAPRVLAVDITCTLLPDPFIIQEFIGGERLGNILGRVRDSNRQAIYRSLGRFYRTMHGVHYSHSGWINGDGTVLPLSPGRYQYRKVIEEIGEAAVERGAMADGTYMRLRNLWSKNLTWLEHHQPSLVYGGLPWTIGMEKRDGDWYITRIMDLHDFLYWDPDWDITGVRYPAFGKTLDSEPWEAFLLEYGRVPCERRIRLYALMQHLDAAMGNYLEPKGFKCEQWKEDVWRTFDCMINEAERQ